MTSQGAIRAAKQQQLKPKFWGKWGALNPKMGEKYIKNAYNRGYGQPLLTSTVYHVDHPVTMLTFLARRWQYDWLKHIAMRVDAQRVPLLVLRRQIWMARLEYWLRRIHTRKAINNAAKVEWAYIKERLRQPFTWTGRDVQHLFFWLLNMLCFCALGETLSRRALTGYPVASPEWAPARPKFTPGFYHVYQPFEDYPFENNKYTIGKQFSRSSWWHNNYETYWAPHRILASDLGIF